MKVWAWLLLLLAAPATAAVPAAPHYAVDAAVDLPNESLSAEVTISLSRERAGREYRFLLGRTFKVEAAEAEGATVRVEETDQPFPQLQAIIVTPTPAASQTIKVKLRYSGRLLGLQSPPINSLKPELVELSVDSMWLPFPHEFNVGLTADAVFRGLPRDAAILSTGTVQRSGDTVRVILDRPNDLTLIASPLLRQVRDGKLTLAAADPEGAQARIYRRYGQDGINFLEPLLGPLPGGSSRVVLVRRASGAGYNRPGYMVVSERAPGSDEWLIGGDLVHEIAHAWWSKGNFLGEDYWLVEGPANYYMHRFGVERFGPEKLAGSLAKSHERARKATAIKGSRPNSDTAYAKGELMLRWLEQRLGRDRFDRFMRDFVDEDTHTTQGFVAMLARHAGEPTAALFEAKLRAPGFEN